MRILSLSLPQTQVYPWPGSIEWAMWLMGTKLSVRSATVLPESRGYTMALGGRFVFVVTS